VTPVSKPAVNRLHPEPPIAGPAAMVGALWCLLALLMRLFTEADLLPLLVLFGLGAVTFAYGSWGLLPVRNGLLPRKGSLLVVVGFAVVVVVVALTLGHVDLGGWTWGFYAALLVVGASLMMVGTEHLKRAAGL